MVLLLTIVCVSVEVTAFRIDQDDDRGQLLAAIQNAYKANWASIPYGNVTFEYAVGRASDVAKGPSAQWQWSQRNLAKGFYAFDGSQGRFERVFHPSGYDVKVRGKEQSLMSIIESVRLLTDGRKTFIDRVSFGKSEEPHHLAQILASSRPFLTEVVFDQNQSFNNTGAPRLDHDIEHAKTSGDVWKVVSLEERVEFRGTEVVRLRFASPRGEREYLIDLKRGALPLRVLDSSRQGLPSNQHNYDDFRLVNGQAWVPYKVNALIAESVAREYKIVKADFETRPPSSTFRLEFETPIPAIDSVDNVMYTPRKIWSLNELPGPNSPSSKKLSTMSPTAAALPPAMPGEKEPGWFDSNSTTAFATLVAIGGLIVLALGVRRWQRA